LDKLCGKGQTISVNTNLSYGRNIGDGKVLIKLQNL